MSDTYEKFARDTYTTLYGAMRETLTRNPGKPLLVISGESHGDTAWEKISNLWTDDAKEEPAMASAYPHIAAMKAAEKLVGKDKMVVSIEQDPQTIQNILAAIGRGARPEDVIPMDRPMGVAMAFAVRQGYRVVGTDAGERAANERHNGDPDKIVDDPQRYRDEINAISNLARGENAAKAVVHVGGASHIMMLSGVQPLQDVDQMTPQQRAAIRNPFEPLFSRPVYINSGDRNTQYDPLTARFAERSQNAIQIDAPGRMDASDEAQIGQRITDIADSFGVTPAAPGATPPAAGPRR